MKRQLYKDMKEYLRAELLRTRAALCISQEEMAHRLLMSSRAYAALECGRSCCSLMTLLLFLSRCCLDRRTFLDGLLKIFESSETETV